MTNTEKVQEIEQHIVQLEREIADLERRFGAQPTYFDVMLELASLKRERNIAYLRLEKAEQ